MSHFISFSGSSIPAGTTAINFDTGKITFSDSTYESLSGNAKEIKSITISTSVAATLYLFYGKESSIIYLPANKYISLIADISNMKIKCSSTFNLLFIASLSSNAPTVT